jgi:hypothetical protein
MRAWKGLAIMLVLLVLGAAPASAHCMEVLFKVTNDNGQLVPINVTVLDKETGVFVQSARTKPGPGRSNFFIDYNNNCFGSNIVNLEVGTEYVLQFHYPDGAKGLCFLREECFGSYDTSYVVTPTEAYKTGGSCVELYGDYPYCVPDPPQSDLAVTLQIYDIDEIGDKVIFYLRATASGGDGSYHFSWDGASSISPTLETNPNLAKRTILQSQTTTVTVTVTSGGESVEDEIILRGEWLP